ncbi:MAG: TonB-dependent receptor [Crocinitomicaceae bacterium]|nr:TonB-dependent receptor [Crocinitomicaceae bacterium]
MKLLLTLLLSVSCLGTVFSQDFNVRGVVYSDVDGEPLSDQKIRLLRIKSNAAGTSDTTSAGGDYTDDDGLFSISKLPKGDYLLQITSFGFITINVEIKITKVTGNKDFTFTLMKDTGIQESDDVFVTAQHIRDQREVNTGKTHMDQAGLERIPSPGGENDILAGIGITPGVITTGDQGGQMYVRGGTPIQNKILLDGMTIYTPFHSIGFFSIFETELIKSADIYTGGFDAQFGGRISSIMDIKYRDGNSKKFSGKVSVSPFMAKLVLEGPLSKPKEGPGAVTYIFSAKQSLINQSSQKLYPNINRDEETGESSGMPFDFTDLYGKITFKGGGRSKVSAFGFHNRDEVNYDIANIKWQQSGGGMNFLLVPSSAPIFIKGHVNGSSFETKFNEALSSTDTLERSSFVGGFDFGLDFTYFLKNNSEINYGLNFGGFSTKFYTFNEVKRKIELENWSTEIGAYFNYRYVSTRWVIQPSFRAQMYASYEGGFSPEPRLGIKYNATENIRLKAAGGRYSQNFTSASSDRDVVNLFNGILSAPENVQSTFTTQYGNEKSPSNGIQYAWHAVGGIEVDLTKKLGLNVEGYYKYFAQLSNINQNKLYDDVAQFSHIDDVFKKDFILENGESFGVDVLLKYSSERMYLWGVYSYGKSQRWDGFQFYSPVFDRRHNVNLVGTYLFGKKKDLEISGRWNLGSGLPFTPTIGFYEAQNFSDGVTTDYTTDNTDFMSTILGEFNSERLPFYHRLDISVKKRFEFKNKSNIEVVASVTNLYNRKNIFYVNRVTGKKIYQFPILPSLGVSYKW